MGFPVVRISLFFLMMNICYAMSQCKKSRPCNVAYRCSSIEDPVWASDGKSCRVFRNGCLLLSTNCARQNNYEPELRETPKELCQSLCKSECPIEGGPVCGYYNEENQTFASQCEMDKYICNTGKTFSLFRVGPCQ